MEIHAFRLLAPVDKSWRMADLDELSELPVPAAFRRARELATRLLSQAAPDQRLSAGIPDEQECF